MIMMRNISHDTCVQFLLEPTVPRVPAHKIKYAHALSACRFYPRVQIRASHFADVSAQKMHTEHMRYNISEFRQPNSKNNGALLNGPVILVKNEECGY